mmetsp:Transcript_110055/g.329014  ORF Transcript_110055/g.329014 Transcript_110055/m.329014 type:complete len:206 (+) Transcript_110055:23-640(+)
MSRCQEGGRVYARACVYYPEPRQSVGTTSKAACTRSSASGKLLGVSGQPSKPRAAARKSWRPALNASASRPPTACTTRSSTAFAELSACTAEASRTSTGTSTAEAAAAAPALVGDEDAGTHSLEASLSTSSSTSTAPATASTSSLSPGSKPASSEGAKSSSSSSPCSPEGAPPPPELWRACCSSRCTSETCARLLSSRRLMAALL